MRYAAELSAPIAGEQAGGLASRLADLHDRLDELQDATVAAAWLNQARSRLTDPDAAFVAGQLYRLQSEERTKARSTWRPLWQASRKPRLRAWLS
jgi:CHAD domain-containing protein